MDMGVISLSASPGERVRAGEGGTKGVGKQAGMVALAVRTSIGAATQGWEAGTMLD